MGLSPVPIPGMAGRTPPPPPDAAPPGVSGTATESRHAQGQGAIDPAEKLRGVMAEVRDMRAQLEGFAREFPEAAAEVKSVAEGLMTMLTKIAVAQRGPEDAGMGTPKAIGVGG